ncbi:cytochrome P450 [Exophiala viscosa]|uniref:Cytochrome P450 n=1 Tax=Exophiala viscosa TaxID=2486360 RepID=A0AAN6DVC5_9EURO|nr:cytochrome P450 [Exophiala viscosa]
MSALLHATQSSSVYLYAASSVLLLGAFAFLYHVFDLGGPKIPKGLRAAPSPPGARLFTGHTHIYAGQVTSNPSESQLVRWAEELGEIYQIQLGTQRWVVLSSPEAIKEVFDRQGTLTSSRATNRVAMGVLSGGYRMLFMPYGKQWRDIRAIVHRCLTVKSADGMKSSQDLESRRYLYDLLTEPANFWNHVKRYSTSVIMYATYGRRILTLEDPVLNDIYTETSVFGECFGQLHLVDRYPILENLPRSLQWWRKKYEPYHQKELQLWLGLWRALKSQVAKGIYTGCFAEKFMENDYPKMGISENQAAYVAGTMIEAGSDTTQLTLNSLILGLLAFPDTVQKAHEELDRVVGQRMPTFEDSDRLPYIRAMVKEVLRWRTASNDHFQHLTTGDVIYKDYFIPAGSYVVGNVWALNFDPVMFPDPQRFNPDRYLDKKANNMTAGECINAQDPRQRDHWGFGAGRRVCAGYTLAENSLFILTARLLWAFDVRAPIDKATGKPLEYDLWNFPATNMFGPNPFRADFKVRDSGREKQILDGLDAFRSDFN